MAHRLPPGSSPCYPKGVKTLKVEWIGLLGFLFSLSLAPLAKAEPGDHSAGLMLGQVWPAGEIATNVDGNMAPGIFYEYTASDVFSLLASGVQSKHSDGLLKIFSANVGMKANLVYFDKLSPYAIVAAGIYNVKKRYGAETISKTNFGLQLGLGAELDISERFFIGLQFDVHNLFSSNVTLANGTRQEISGRWTGFFLRGGVRF